MFKWIHIEQYEQQGPYFDKKMTNINKGIALIMMFILHFFTTPDWWVDGVYYPALDKLAPQSGLPFIICVFIFCFLTGYFYFYAKKKTLSYSIIKITDLLVIYWIIFFLLAVLAVVTTGYQYTPAGILKEMFAIWRPTMFFCWYVLFYYSFMLILPFVANKLLSKGIVTDLLSLVGISIAIRVLIRLNSMYIMNSVLEDFALNMTRFPIVLTGYLFAKYSLFERMEHINKKYIPSKAGNIILWSLMLVLVPLIRIFTQKLDFIYAPLFIYAVVNLGRKSEDSIFSKVLIIIGKYSCHMWFIHCIFFNNAKEVFQPILYLPHNPVLVLIWGLLLCLIVSVVLDPGVIKINKIKNKWMLKMMSK